MSDKSVTVYDSITGTDTNQWDEVVRRCPSGSIYQTSGWLRSLEEALSLSGTHAVVEKDESPVGVLPNIVADVRLPSRVERELPDSLTELFTELSSLGHGYGGPAIVTDEAETLSLLLSKIREQTDGPTVLSHYVRAVDQDDVRYAAVYTEYGYRPTVKQCRRVLDLSREYEDIKSSMDKDRRYDIRKGNERDPSVETDRLSEHDLSSFYEGYAETMQRVGADPYPKRFFESLGEQLGDSAKIATVHVDGAVRGRHLYLVDDFGDALRHEFSAVSADDFEYQPSEILHDRMIQWGTEHGYGEYDMGSTPANVGDGLFKYKRQYGGDTVPVVVWEQDLSILWKLYRFARHRYRKHRT